MLAHLFVRAIHYNMQRIGLHKLSAQEVGAWKYLPLPKQIKKSPNPGLSFLFFIVKQLRWFYSVDAELYAHEAN